MATSDRFDHAIAAIDAGNGDDPNVVTVRGRTGPKEVLHAELVSEWVERLQPGASEPLRLAARGHHFRRWTVPRSSAPAGRAGYLKWRKARQADQARELGALLAGAGYDDATVGRVQAIVRKENLADDTEVQALEDALCLVFLETQLADVAARLEPDVLSRVLVRTAKKMSAAGLAAISEVPLDASARALLEGALARDVVDRYLAGLAADDWDAVTATLAVDVDRMGPYRDAFRGRDAYASFLAQTIDALGGYQLDVDRVHVSGPIVTVELRETVDDGDARLETSEAVVFDTAGALITHVAVYLQTSERHPHAPSEQRARMTTPLCTLDLARMRKARMDKLRDAMATAGIDALVLCSQSNVSYATGSRVPTADHVRAAWWRAVAVVERDDPWPHLFTEFPEGSPVDLPNDHLHPAVEVEAAGGAAELVEQLPTGRLGLDDAPFALWQALQFREVVDGSLALAPAKLTKTIDELECIRQAQAINERAMRTVRETVAAGVPATTLSGTFLREIAELGASANVVDPVFNVMPASIADGPYSVTGDPVFPLPTQPRVLDGGDVLWIDTGINLNGYSSDFGATWIVGGKPDAHARSQFSRWRDTVDRVLEVTKPGATGADLVRAATEPDGTRPWLSYFYLAHGTGTDPAEMPLIGTDRGDEFDASIVLAPGMVLVLEPVVWDDGHCGHRSEEIVAVTDDGYTRLSSRAELDGVGI